MRTETEQVIKCKKHPTYKGVKPDTKNCVGCMLVYLHRRVTELEQHVSYLYRRINEQDGWS